MPAIEQHLSEEELGRELRSAVQKIIDQEVEAEIAGVQERLATKVRERLGKLASNVISSRQFGMPQINISVTIGEPEQARPT